MVLIFPENGLRVRAGVPKQMNICRVLYVQKDKVIEGRDSVGDISQEGFV